MDRDLRQFLTWWLCALLFVALCAMFSGCVRPPVVKTQTRIDTVMVTKIAVLLLPDSVYDFGKRLWTVHTEEAQTTCDVTDWPIIYIKPWAFADSVRRKYTLVHEMRHVKQVLAYQGGCTKMMEQYANDPDFVWEIEAEAWCAAFEAQKADKVEVHKAWDRLLRVMNTYDTSLALDDVVNYVPCRETG